MYRGNCQYTTADLGHVMVPSLFRERKPKVYASYAICECCVQEQEMDRRTSSYRSQEIDRRGATSYRRYRDSQASLNNRSERAASAPPQTTGSPKKHGTNTQLQLRQLYLLTTQSFLQK